MTTARRTLALLSVVALVGVLAACGDDDAPDDPGPDATAPDDAAPPDDVDPVRLNHLQVLGSHNSYKLRPDSAVLAAVSLIDEVLAAEMDYEHRPLVEQLDEHGLRQIELDVYADPEGGRFADRPALTLVDLPTASGEPALDEPGFKVMHTSDVDFETTCFTLVACLGEVEEWSSANPDHLPVMIMVEAKTSSLRDLALGAGVDLDDLGVPTTDVLPMTPELFDDLEAEILSVFDRDRIITPDDVRGDHDTLDEAVRTGEAWPTVEESRGKVLFSLIDLGVTMDTYIGESTALEGKLMFTSSQEGRPDAAFLRIDDPVTERARLVAAVEAGYMVRTRSDVPAQDAVEGDTTRRDAAFDSGAHYISTDYYVPDPSLGTDFRVSVPDAPPGVAARCNPVVVIETCRTDDLAA